VPTSTASAQLAPGLPRPVRHRPRRHWYTCTVACARSAEGEVAGHGPHISTWWPWPGLRWPTSTPPPPRSPRACIRCAHTC